MITIRQALLLAAVMLATLAIYASAAEEGTPGTGTTKTEGPLPGSGEGKAALDEKKKAMRAEIEKIHEVVKKFEEERRAYLKSEMERFRTFAEGMKGKSGSEISPSLTTFYIQQYSDAKAHIEKSQTELTAAVKALSIPDELKTKALERIGQRYKDVLANLEERQEDRLVFAKSLGGLTAEEVAVAVKNRREEVRAEMKKKREEMQQKREEMQQKREEHKKNRGKPGKEDGVPPVDKPGEDGGEL